VQRWSWQNLLVERDHSPECVAIVLRPDLPRRLPRSPREMLRKALSQLAWAQAKAVVGAMLPARELCATSHASGGRLEYEFS
jgi:hypothetical protein